ncbi:MAG: hypothetical protein ACC649_04860 [Myxococcota bacterium]
MPVLLILKMSRSWSSTTDQQMRRQRVSDPELTPEMPAIKRWSNAWVARLV